MGNTTPLPFVVCTLLLVAPAVIGHPLCLFGPNRPPDTSGTLSFCPAQDFGVCCTTAEEDEVIAEYNAAGDLPAECAELHAEVGI